MQDDAHQIRLRVADGVRRAFTTAELGALRIVDAPTGSGKTYSGIDAAIDWVLAHLEDSEPPQVIYLAPNNNAVLEKHDEFARALEQRSLAGTVSLGKFHAVLGEADSGPFCVSIANERESGQYEFGKEPTRQRILDIHAHKQNPSRHHCCNGSEVACSFATQCPIAAQRGYALPVGGKRKRSPFVNILVTTIHYAYVSHYGEANLSDNAVMWIDENPLEIAAGSDPVLLKLEQLHILAPTIAAKIRAWYCTGAMIDRGVHRDALGTNGSFVPSLHLEVAQAIKGVIRVQHERMRAFVEGVEPNPGEELRWVYEATRRWSPAEMDPVIGILKHILSLLTPPAVGARHQVISHRSRVLPSGDVEDLDRRRFHQRWSRTAEGAHKAVILTSATPTTPLQGTVVGLPWAQSFRCEPAKPLQSPVIQICGVGINTITKFGEVLREDGPRLLANIKHAVVTACAARGWQYDPSETLVISRRQTGSHEESPLSPLDIIADHLGVSARLHYGAGIGSNEYQKYRNYVVVGNMRPDNLDTVQMLERLDGRRLTGEDVAAYTARINACKPSARWEQRGQIVVKAPFYADEQLQALFAYLTWEQTYQHGVSRARAAYRDDCLVLFFSDYYCPDATHFADYEALERHRLGVVALTDTGLMRLDEGRFPTRKTAEVWLHRHKAALLRMVSHPEWSRTKVAVEGSRKRVDAWFRST